VLWLQPPELRLVLVKMPPAMAVVDDAVSKRPTKQDLKFFISFITNLKKFGCKGKIILPNEAVKAHGINKFYINFAQK